jgi:hypothetical protein
MVLVPTIGAMHGSRAGAGGGRNTKPKIRKGKAMEGKSTKLVITMRVDVEGYIEEHLGGEGTAEQVAVHLRENLYLLDCEIVQVEKWTREEKWDTWTHEGRIDL